jgi:hypothetical protein
MNTTGDVLAFQCPDVQIAEMMIPTGMWALSLLCLLFACWGTRPSYMVTVSRGRRDTLSGLKWTAFGWSCGLALVIFSLAFARVIYSEHWLYVTLMITTPLIQFVVIFISTATRNARARGDNANPMSMWSKVVNDNIFRMAEEIFVGMRVRYTSYGEVVPLYDNPGWAMTFSNPVERDKLNKVCNVLRDDFNIRATPDNFDTPFVHGMHLYPGEGFGPSNV